MTDLNITRPGVYKASWSSWTSVNGVVTEHTGGTFTASLPGRYSLTGELVRVAADPPIFPRMSLLTH